MTWTLSVLHELSPGRGGTYYVTRVRLAQCMVRFDMLCRRLFNDHLSIDPRYSGEINTTNMALNVFSPASNTSESPAGNRYCYMTSSSEEHHGKITLGFFSLWNSVWFV